MVRRTARARRRSGVLVVVMIVVAVLLAAAYALTREDEATEATPVTLFMSYIPSVQFAPIYVAAHKGYFADEGIDITFEHSFNEADGVERIANNDLKFGLVSGEQVVLARARSRPVVYIFEWYHRFPVGIVSLAEHDITEPGDLVDRVVGVPGPQGASYIGLLALLDATGLREGDLRELRSIGFAAPENICEEKVEAAVVYIANEPLTIETQCDAVNVIEVADYTTLVSNGMITNERTIREEPDLVRGMVRAVRRGLLDVLADPDEAFEISVQNYVTDLTQDQYATQRQVLQNSIALWGSADPGRTTPSAWDDTEAILLDAGLLEAPLQDLHASYTMDFLPED